MRHLVITYFLMVLLPLGAMADSGFNIVKLLNRMYAERVEGGDFHPQHSGSVLPDGNSIYDQMTKNGAWFSPYSDFLNQNPQKILPEETAGEFFRRQASLSSAFQIGSRIANEFREASDMKELFRESLDEMYRELAGLNDRLSKFPAPTPSSPPSAAFNEVYLTRNLVEERIVFRIIADDFLMLMRENFLGSQNYPNKKSGDFTGLLQSLIFQQTLDVILKRMDVKLEDSFNRFKNHLGPFVSSMNSLSAVKKEIELKRSRVIEANKVLSAILPPTNDSLTSEELSSLFCQMRKLACNDVGLKMEEVVPEIINEAQAIDELYKKAVKIYKIDAELKRLIDLYYLLAGYQSGATLNSLLHLARVGGLELSFRTKFSPYLPAYPSTERMKQSEYLIKIKTLLDKMKQTGKRVPDSFYNAILKLEKIQHIVEKFKPLLIKRVEISNKNFERNDNPPTHPVRRFDKKYWFRLHEVYPGSPGERLETYNTPLELMLKSDRIFYPGQYAGQIKSNTSAMIFQKSAAHQHKRTCECSGDFSQDSVNLQTKCEEIKPVILKANKIKIERAINDKIESGYENCQVAGSALFTVFDGTTDASKFNQQIRDVMRDAEKQGAKCDYVSANVTVSEAPLEICRSAQAYCCKKSDSGLSAEFIKRRVTLAKTKCKAEDFSQMECRYYPNYNPLKTGVVANSLAGLSELKTNLFSGCKSWFNERCADIEEITSELSLNPEDQINYSKTKTVSEENTKIFNDLLAHIQQQSKSNKLRPCQQACFATCHSAEFIVPSSGSDQYNDLGQIIQTAKGMCVQYTLLAQEILKNLSVKNSLVAGDLSVKTNGKVGNGAHALLGVTLNDVFYMMEPSHDGGVEVDNYGCNFYSSKASNSSKEDQSFELIQ